MGIPKFYRWLSERYPCVNQPISEANVPILDNLYLDMNGIIHNCTHGNDPGTKLTEDQMVAKIYMYLERLMSIVQPQKLLYMAIDGVAPRAKMNQQRSRRFKSAKERKEAEAELIRKGELVEGEGFDSNCITPGTEFMARLNNHLRFFIRKKISEDVLWQKPTIILSGHDVPGEGEHKIMEFIRRAKNLPDYEPNQRHCMYGLDADLIMLSLVSHEPHFCLLREVVSFGGGNKGRPSREVLENPCAEHFVLFHLGLLRDYFEKEFQPAFTDTGVTFNIERIVDDFVLFCMLIGNDFLPALPTLDVNEGALDQIFSIYKAKIPIMGGYLTDGGILNRGRFELLLRGLAELESETLEKRAADAEEFESRRSRGTRGFGDGRPPGPGPLAAAEVSELSDEDQLELDLAAATLGEAGVEDLALMVKLEGEEEAVAAAPTMMSKEARNLFLSGDPDLGLKAWKERYYREKLGCDTPLERRAVVDVYLAGLLWVLDYYYRGVSSWTWFYPYHYSPMCSDLVNLDSIHVEFQIGAPFLPFQQLLAVLPAASADLLPKPYKELMTSPSSPIIDFYPENFRIDLEGKRSDWEGIVLVPFIDEARLLAAESTITPDKLTKDERGRNVRGDILIFNHAENSTETEFCTSTLASGRTSIVCNSRCTRQAPPPPLSRQEHGFLPALIPGTIVGKGGPPGFPTLNTVKLTSRLEGVGVNVLGVASKKDSLILQLMDPSNGNPPPLKMVADLSLGHHCWIRWPYVVEAIVEGVSNAKEMITKEGSKVHTKEEELEWMRNADQLIRDFLIKKGIHLGPVSSLFHVRPCQGLVRRTDGTIEKRFAKELTLSPIPATLRRNVAMKDPRFDPELAAAVHASTQFKVGDKALFVARSNYGALATVLPNPSTGLSREGVPLPTETSGMLHIRLEPTPPPAVAAASTARRIVDSVKVHYEPSGAIARRLGVSARALGKVTGNFYVEEGDDKYDVGLCVKHGGRGMCVPDYVQPAPDDRGWLFSPALVQILADYKRKFPWIFSFLEENLDEGVSAPAATVLPSLSPADRVAALQKLKGWIKGLPLSRRPLVKTSAKVVPEDVIRNLQATLPPMPAQPQSYIELENVPPWLLLAPVQPHSHIASDLAGGGFDLGDRVVSLSASGVPPLGLRGTVVGIHDNACEVLFDREFPEGTDLHGRCSGKFGLMMAADHLLNISKPRAINVTGHLAPRIVRKARPREESGTQLHGSVGKASDHPVDTYELANGTTKSRLSPDKVRPKVHVPLAPASPSQRGFGAGRGKPQPGDAPAAPGSDPLAGPFHPAYRRAGMGPGLSAVPLSQSAQDRHQTRQAGHALLALVQGDAKAGGNPQEPASPAAPSQSLPASFPTPPGVHHSPFGHIRPPTLTFPGPFQAPSYASVNTSKAPLVSQEQSLLADDGIPLSDLLLGTPSQSLTARAPTIPPPPGWPLSGPQPPLFPRLAGQSLSAHTPVLPASHQSLHSVGPGSLPSSGLFLPTSLSGASLMPDQPFFKSSPMWPSLPFDIPDRAAIPVSLCAPVQAVPTAAPVNPSLPGQAVAAANPMTNPPVGKTLSDRVSAVPAPPGYCLSTPMPAVPPPPGLSLPAPASSGAAASGQFVSTPALAKPPPPGLGPMPPASKAYAPGQLSDLPGSCASVIPSSISKAGKPCGLPQSPPAGAEGEDSLIKAVTTNCMIKSTTDHTQGTKFCTRGTAPQAFAPLGKRVPHPVVSHASLSPDTPPSNSIVGPNTPRQGPAALPTHTLVPSPTDDPTAEQEESKSNASKAADPDSSPCIFADVDFPALTQSAPKSKHGSSVARRDRGAARTGTTGAEASLSTPAVFWTLLQQQNSATAKAAVAAPARSSPPTPPAPSPHPILEQLRYKPRVPPPPNLPRPLPTPVTLPPPNVLPQPVTLPRPDGAVLLEKLKRGPLGAPDAGKALLKKLQKPPVPVGSGSRASSKKVTDELSEAAKLWLDSRRADAQGPLAAPKTEGKASAISLPKPSDPVDLSEMAIAAREAASNALKGVDETLSRSQSSSTSPRSPVNGVHAPLVFDEESVVKAKRAADAALRGVKEAAIQGSGPVGSADAVPKGQDHEKSALLRGALGIGRGVTASNPPTEAESEASRRAKEAAAEALKGLLKKSLPAKEAPASTNAALHVEEASTKVAKSDSSKVPAGPSCTPAEYWQGLMR